MKIEPNIMTVLEAAEVNGNKLVLTGQLDRKTYAETNKVLEAIGGKWDRKAKAHVFGEDAADLVDQVLLTGEYTRTKQDFGQFDTPPALAAHAVALAKISPDMLVLEPNVGIGNIVAEIIKVQGTGANVYGYEIDKKRLDECRSTHFNAFGAGGLGLEDFLQVVPVERFDRVVMNPPFAKQADIDHVLHAVKFLKPGGRLVAIMSASVLFRENAKTAKFRTTVKALGGTIEKLPENAFKESGTSVNTCLVVFDWP